MSKKTITIIVSSILIVFLLALVGYYFMIGRGDSTGGSILDGFRSFIPFGGGGNTTDNTDGSSTGTTTPQNNQSEGNNFVQKLRKISSEPVSGAGTQDSKAGTVIRYIEKATGHIYEVELFSPKKGRISNTTIPLAYDAVWGNKNNSLIARYLKLEGPEVQTYSLNLASIATTTENTISGIEFPENISDVSVFGSNIFYLQSKANGSDGYISDFTGSKKKMIWSSPIKELASQFVNDKFVILTTKPHESTLGYMYSVNTSSGDTKKIIGGITGLSGVSNSDISKVLFLNQDPTLFGLYIRDTKNNSSQKLDFVTFPEKCVWSKKNTSMVYCAVPYSQINPGTQTDWYKGLVTTSDHIWMYNSADNSGAYISDLEKEGGEQIDLIKPTLSENEQYLIFTNKKDGSLWSLDLTKDQTTTTDL